MLRLLGPDFDDADLLLNAVFCHHGRPVPVERDLASHMGRSTDSATRAVVDFAGAVHDVFDGPQLPPLKRNAARPLSWQLAGAVALADWLGSDQRFFPYELAEGGIADYWGRCAQPRALAAVAASGLVPSPLADAPIGDRILPRGAVATAAQAWASSIAIEGRSLFLIEDDQCSQSAPAP